MAPVDTKNPPPDNVQDITTASGNGQRRRGKPVPQRPVEPTAPLIDSPGDVDLFDMDPKSIVTPRRYHDEPPAAREALLEQPGDTGAGQTPRDAPSSNPSQSAEDLVDQVQHPAASAPAARPSQSDDELIQQLEEIQQGSPGAIRPVTGTAYLPADTPTSRPKPPRRGRTPRTGRTAPRPTLTRGRARKGYISFAGLLVVAVAIAAVATNSSPRGRIASAATGAKSGLVVTSTKTVNPLELIATAIAPAVKRQEAVDRSRARRAPKKISSQHHTHHVRRTTVPAVHPATSAPSQVATTTAAPAPATSSNSYHPAATEPRAPSQQAGPTGPGTTVGKNCDPQCS
jgi:hypothetical protein